ncbi:MULTISPECIES: hypothetical protein [unclassified Micromonospora]|nr:MULTISPECIES: hypothetical protein [unclassified Micromonospora]
MGRQKEIIIGPEDGLISPAVVAERIELVTVHHLVMKRLRDWIARYLPAT